MIIKYLMIAAGAVALPAAATAQMVTAKDPQSVIKVMQAAGYQARLDKDGSGDPLIHSASSGTPFGVDFYNCTDHANCSSVRFEAGYKVEPGKAPSLELLNKWNSSKRFTAAFLDKEGDPCLVMDLNLDVGGLSTALFQDYLRLWVSLLADYEKHIGS